MYGHLMMQIEKEVKHSISQSSEILHPLKSISQKPLDKDFVDQIKFRVNEKI
jgi:hypothetical protein